MIILFEKWPNRRRAREMELDRLEVKSVRSKELLYLLAPATLRERHHRGLERRRVAVGRRAILMMSNGERPAATSP
jgi:hypothetical protein